MFESFLRNYFDVQNASQNGFYSAYRMRSITVINSLENTSITSSNYMRLCTSICVDIDDVYRTYNVYEKYTGNSIYISVG